MTDRHTEVSPTDVAIIGIACNFAGAPGPEAFWERICEGRELLTHFSEDDLRAAGIPEQLLANPDYIRVSSLVDGAGDFDADFFGITPSESRLMDPQHRLMLELGWHAMEDAGYDPSRYPGDVGVFVGGGRHAYLRYIEPEFDPEDHLDGSIRGLQADIGNYGDFLATRISYRLGLTGPSLNVQTACSTALVAVHLACQSLFLGESDLALAGGVNLHTPQVNGYLYEEGSICSPDGRLRPFDADANGSVFGNGGGLVVLKRLSDAMAEGDRVIAVIKGSAINNDGSEKMTFTGPSVDGQAEVISRALRVADVDPATVGFVETHGTGTALGDPIEVAALVSAFGPAADDAAGCALGAVKAQIGHLGTSAGVAGIIKAALVLERAEIPPMVNFTSLNPGIELTGSPFYIPTESRPFEGLRRAGVSAFGVGGTNAHAVLEQAPAAAPVPLDSGDGQEGRVLPFVLSARSADALAALRTAHGLALRSRPGRAADAAHVLARGRKRFRHRTFVTAATAEEAAAQLTSGATTISGVAPEAELPVVFAFAGEGGQYAGLGRALYEGDAAYRRTVDDLSELALDIAGFDVRALLYPEPGDEEVAADRLSRALWAQPAMFVSQYALATSLIAAGVVPHTMVGHSLGEYAAACVAGMLSTSDALRLVSTRGRLMQEETPDGAMLAVGLDEDELRAILPADLDVAGVNAVGQCVVSGATGAIDAFQAHLEETDLRHTRLGTSNAAHSRLMAGIVEEYRALLARVEFGKPSMRIVSTVTGREIGPDEMADPEYWIRHMLQPVRFRDAARTVLEDGPVTVVEAGPGRALTRMFENSGGAAESRPVTPWMRNEWSPKSTAELLGAVWVQGGRIDWDRQFAGLEPHRVSLPGYPFERSEHWIDVTQDHSPVELPGLRRSSRITGWLQVPRWTVAPPSEAAPAPAGPRRVLLPRPAVSAAADALASALEAAGHSVVPLLPGDRPELDPAGSRLVVRPGDHDDLRLLYELLAAGGSGVDTVLFAGLPDRGAGQGPLAGRVTDALEQGFWPLVTAVRGVAADRGERGLDVLVVTADRHQVAADDPIDPVASLLTGPCRVLPQEYPTVRLAELDLSAGLEPKAAAALVLAELGRPVTARTVAHRAGIRRLLAHEPLPALTAGRPWRDGCSYLITGGLGAIGLALAEDAAESAGVTLVLTHRSAWPAEDEWERVAEDPATSPEWRERVAVLLRLRRAGAAVHCVRADAADREAMREVRERYGPFHGVVHAAGVPSGRLAAVLDDEHVRRVMSPKVDGALVLDEVVSDATTEWTAYCSSMSAVVGGLGHTDYCSANAFLDAFAQWRTAAGRRTVSLGFDAWTEGGMAVKEATRSRTTSAAEEDGEDWRPFEHPVFSARAGGPGYGVFRGELRRGADWILDEHRVAGRSLVPGTAVVEFVRAAAEAHLGTTGFDITELDLLRPLSAPGATLAFTVRVDGSAGDDDEVTVTVFGLGPDQQWYRQAVGRIEPGAPGAEPQERLEIPAGSGEAGSLPGSDLITFGPRWDNIERIWRSGADELLLDCRLPSRFTDDLGRYGIHPALLDTAAGALVSGVSDRVHLPMSYERITVHAPMPARIVSRITHRESGESGSLLFDVRVQDGAGQPVLDILGYSLREVDPDRVAADLGADADAVPAAAANRSLVSTEAGDLSALRMVPAERHEPAAGEIEVEVRATGLNFKEVLIAAGALDAPGPDHRFGLECAGVVTAVGEGVSRFRVGDAVMAVGASCFSDYVVVRDALACRIPAGMTFSQAASIPVAFTTAYDCLVNVGALARGERVLVHAAAGGVGLAALQIAAHRGAEVFATAGNETKRNVVEGLGATLVMDSRSLDFEAETLAAGGVDVVLNSLAGEFIPAGMRTLRPRGRFVEIGRRDILANTPLDLGLFASGRTFGAYNPEIDGDAWERAWRSVVELLQQGVITPLPVRTFGADEADEAFSFMSRAHHIGKVVVIRTGGNEPVTGHGADAGEAAGAEGITARRGVLAFRDALGAGPAHVLVSRRVPAATGDQFVVAGHVLQGGGTGSSVHSRPELPYPLTPLEGDTEERLGALWGGLLSIEQIGRDDRFLDLGGDSLYATQLVARIRNAFGVRVAPADILGGLSVRELAELIDRRLTAATEAGA
ncbi:acyltransferase domain-containing protein [Streptomyces sp. NBC_01335]|uniref:polyketide synthase n=1 Tax=Streptomyces sp. NBC_01335 TaxID=2903828 RepID=UPI002E12AAC1|nr:polyketide synthase [Streptomyces sp. NBC_01335]WSI69137.1 acyltransferase domain-containing protein [Streptomyces sp. NBC_01335]